ncbi:MAG: hypothetical protein JF615_11755 [Asticcacaulis sp.]|nr:hypothetical protein [Asticcacaulis sp.]
MTMNAQVVPFPTHRPPAPTRRPSLDGEYFEDDLPPELFDEDEDRDDLTTYVHIAQSALED